MENYKPNSHRSKEGKLEPIAEKKIEKVVSGKVKVKKKSEIQKFAESFISEDISNIKDYAFRNVLIPSIKKAISEIVDMFLYGESTSDKRSSSGSRISYRSYYDKRNDRDYRETSTSRNRFDRDPIIIDNRGEAEAVIEQMIEIIGRFGVVSVADLYDMIDEIPPHTANKYGWTDLRTAKVVPVREGYLLKLPRIMPID